MFDLFVRHAAAAAADKQIKQYETMIIFQKNWKS